MTRRDNVTQLVTRLERAILSGVYAPGTLLPSEREISGQLSVSRSVVREALQRLASLGLVRSRPGSGTRVEAPSSGPVTEAYQRLLSRSEMRLADLAAVRMPLETTIAALAAAHRTAEDLGRLHRTQTVLGNPRRSLDAHMRADLDFHAHLADATGNPMFRLVLSPIQELLLESRRRTLGRYGAAIAHEHHATILAAVQAQDAVAATAAMRMHIEANFQHLQGSDEQADGNGSVAERSARLGL